MYFVLSYVSPVVGGVGGDALVFVGSYLRWSLSKLWQSLLGVYRFPPGPPPELQGKGSDGYKGGEEGTWRRIRKR